MKRTLAILLAVCLLLTASSVATVASAATAQTHNFTQLQGYYKTQGRVEVVDGALNMDTSSSGFEFYFYGSGNVTMGADVWCKYTNNMFFTVIVDGVRHSSVEVYTGTTAKSVYKNITLVENLAEGYHHIEVYKQTEASSALVTVWGVTFAGTPVVAPPEDNIVIEVVGDSISGGASNLATNDTANASYPVYQDGLQTYAYLTGEALGANVRVTQTSGYGCCGGWNSQGTGLNLQDMFPYTSYWRDHTDAGLYEFNPPADIVVINLGTNDASAAKYGKINLTNEQFKAGAKNLMTMARQKNPNAKIVWVTGMMGVTYQTELTAAVAELGGAAGGYFFTILPEGTSGGEGHPNVAQHRAAATVLTAFLLENCLPQNYKANFTDTATLQATVNNAKTVSAPSAALTQAITLAQMDIDCGTTDAYRLGVRKTAIEEAMNGAAIGLNLMPVKGVTQTPYSNDIHYVWPYYDTPGMVTLYKGGEGHYWPYVHTEYQQLLNTKATPFLTVEVQSTAEWNIHIAYLDKNGTRQTGAASTVDGRAADYAANAERTTHRIDFGSYVAAQGHADSDGYVTIVGCDIYVVGVTDTYVQLHTCAFAAQPQEVLPDRISGSYAVTDGLLATLAKDTTAEQLIAAGQEMTEMRSGMERIEDVTNYEEDVVFAAGDDEKITAPMTGNISIRNVTFGYSRQAAPVLKDFSLELTPGRKVALVGSSGCGKSTIARLVAGLYQPWEGEILFDGKPMSAYDRAAFTSSVAVVDQDIFLFSGTVKDNFRFADGTITDADMIRAARDAQVHEAILKHEGGYDARIAEGGSNFSGGQRQQLEIARALAGNPSILILDEATSALDAQSEALVMDAIKARGMTMLLVAHRLSTIREADVILVMKDGVVTERGTHEELLALNGDYAALVSAS